MREYIIAIGLLLTATLAFAGDFTDKGNGTVLDENTGLVWQQSDDGTTRSWQESLDYCNELTLGGKSNWRLPNVKELRSLVDVTKYDPAIDDVFTGAHSADYWSSTTLIGVTSAGWAISFNSGDSDLLIKTDNKFARCVR